MALPETSRLLTRELPATVRDNIRWDDFLTYLNRLFPEFPREKFVEQLQAILRKAGLSFPAVSKWTVLSVDTERGVVKVVVGRGKIHQSYSYPRVSFEILCTQEAVELAEQREALAKEQAAERARIMRAYGSIPVTAGLHDGTNLDGHYLPPGSRGSRLR